MLSLAIFKFPRFFDRRLPTSRMVKRQAEEKKGKKRKIEEVQDEADVVSSESEEALEESASESESEIEGSQEQVLIPFLIPLTAETK